MKEETGLDIKENELIFLDKLFIGPDNIENGTNNHFETIYAYRFKSDIDVLRIEDGEIDKFMWILTEKLLNLEDDFKEQLVPYLLSEKVQNILKKIKQLND